jgi:CheY-like chemotaxis protein
MSATPFKLRVSLDESVSSEPAGVLGPPKRPPRIVIVDDEEFMGEIIEWLVKEELVNVTVLRFQNRDTAWEELQRADPDLLITDMNNDNIPGRTEYMGMSGWELLPRLAERRVSYPVLVVSGSFLMPGWEAAARRAGGRELDAWYVTKPFTAELFRRVLARVLSPGLKSGRRTPPGRP